MLSDQISRYKFLDQLVIWNIFFGIICIPTAGKLIDVMGTPLSISIYYFPFVYIIADIMTEVYGYAIARRVLWFTMLVQVIATAIFQFVVLYPPSPAMSGNQSYVEVLSQAPRLVLFGNIAMFIGDVAQQLCFSEDEGVDKWPLRRCAVFDIHSMRTDREYDCFLCRRSVGKYTNRRVNGKHYSGKHCEGWCGADCFASFHSNSLLAEETRKRGCLRQRDGL